MRAGLGGNCSAERLRPTLSCTRVAYGEPVKSTLGIRTTHARPRTRSMRMRSELSVARASTIMHYSTAQIRLRLPEEMMSIQITGAGKIIDREMRLQTTCTRCATTYTFQYSDVNSYSGGVDSDGNQTGSEGVSCPRCHVICQVSKDRFYRDPTFFESLFR